MFSYNINVADGITAAPAAPAAGGGAEVAVKAPMPGLILKLNVAVGDSVKKDDVLMVMEAMKMENEIFAPEDGVVKEIKVKQGDQMQADEILLVLAGSAPAAAPAAATSGGSPRSRRRCRY